MRGKPDHAVRWVPLVSASWERSVRCLLNHETDHNSRQTSSVEPQGVPYIRYPPRRCGNLLNHPEQLVQQAAKKGIIFGNQDFHGLPTAYGRNHPFYATFSLRRNITAGLGRMEDWNPLIQQNGTSSTKPVPKCDAPLPRAARITVSNPAPPSCILVSKSPAFAVRSRRDASRSVPWLLPNPATRLPRRFSASTS